MTSLERMMVEFPEPMADQIRAAVEAGDYTSTDEAVRDAVRLWSNGRLEQDRERERLGQAWDAGKASGLYGPLDVDALRREAREHLAGLTSRAD